MGAAEHWGAGTAWAGSSVQTGMALRAAVWEDLVRAGRDMERRVVEEVLVAGARAAAGLEAAAARLVAVEAERVALVAQEGWVAGLAARAVVGPHR